MSNEKTIGPVDVLAVRAAEILAESFTDRENLAIRIARMEQRDAAVADLVEFVRTVEYFTRGGPRLESARTSALNARAAALVVAVGHDPLPIAGRAS